MKEIYRSVLLTGILWALCACGGTDPVTPDDPDPKPEPETHTLTFVLPSVTGGESAGLKAKWQAGDQIVVHGEYARDQVVVTLDAGDISVDGKSATKKVDGLYPYKRDDCASTLYASYPASVSNNLKHCFFYSQFSTTNEQIMAACNSGETFQFENICAVLSLKAEGNFEGYTISTPKKEALGYEFLQVKLTDNEQNYKQYVGNPIIQLDGKASGSDIRVFFPEGTAFESGFVIKFKEGGDYTRIYKNSTPIEFTRGSVVDLGDITAEIQDYVNPFSSDIKDLDAAGNANCYIVSAPGGYKFKAVYGNEPTNFLKDVEDAVVLWETWNDDSEVTPGSVLASAAYAEDYIIIRTPSALHPGNAVVAARNAAGTILWSWHIWIPETAVQTGNFGGIMVDDLMDRNLGALVATSATDASIDPRSYGLMYQWGRKDPFTAAGSFNGKTPATWAGEGDEVAQAQISLEESIAFPRRLGHINNGDWLTITDDNLWNETEKSIYDPCPPGYRVPKYKPAGSFWSGDLTAQPGWSANVEAGWFKIGSPDASVFPLAGYRDDYEVGGIAKVGVRTLYWVATGSGATGSCANLRSDSGYKFGSAPKARLGSVRCVAE